MRPQRRQALLGGKKSAMAFSVTKIFPIAGAENLDDRLYHG